MLFCFNPFCAVHFLNIITLIPFFSNIPSFYNIYKSFRQLPCSQAPFAVVLTVEKERPHGRQNDPAILWVRIVVICVLIILQSIVFGHC